MNFLTEDTFALFCFSFELVGLLSKGVLSDYLD